jgi:carbamoyl-phosphate synthase large subunit
MTEPGKKITVLFTGAGGAGTIYILKHLKRHGIFRTIAIDMDKYAPGLYFADAGYVVPPVGSEDYFPKVEEIIKREKVDVAVPLIDEELIGFCGLTEKIGGLEVLLPKKQFVEMAVDKLRMANEFSGKGIPVPESSKFEKGANAHKYPFVIKPRFSRGSRGFAVIRAARELDAYLSSTKFPIEQLMVQHFVDGTEYTVSAVVSKDGKLLAVVPKEVITKRGITQVGITRKDKKIEELCHAINEKFEPCGPFNVQLITDKKDGNPYVIEVNPRYSTTVALTIEAGVDEVGSLILDRMGRKFGINRDFRENLAMLRYYEQVFLEENTIKGLLR